MSPKGKEGEPPPEEDNQDDGRELKPDRDKPDQGADDADPYVDEDEGKAGADF